MWICFNDAFVSAVEHNDDSNLLVVRARNAKHLRKLFPGTKILRNKGTDYAARVIISKVDFAALVLEHVFKIDYGNFKDSVDDNELHNLYLRMWAQHKGYQDIVHPEPKKKLLPHEKWLKRMKSR